MTASVLWSMDDVAKGCHSMSAGSSLRTDSETRRLTFVENQELALADKRTSERQNLPLSDREVPATARNLGVQRNDTSIVLVVVCLKRMKAGCAKGSVERCIIVLVERVKVFAKGPAQQLGRLRNDSDLGAQIVEADSAGVDTVVEYCTFCVYGTQQ